MSATAFGKRVFSREPLQKLVYAQVKAWGLSAQPALHVICKVADACTTLHAQIEMGLLGGEWSRKRRKAESKPVAFRPAAQPFDDRCLGWQVDARTVSIWTAAGRMRGVRFTGSPAHLKILTGHRKGETDLVLGEGSWFL